MIKIVFENFFNNYLSVSYNAGTDDTVVNKIDMIVAFIEQNAKRETSNKQTMVVIVNCNKFFL